MRLVRRRPRSYVGRPLPVKPPGAKCVYLNNISTTGEVEGARVCKAELSAVVPITPILGITSTPFSGAPRPLLFPNNPAIEQLSEPLFPTTVSQSGFENPDAWTPVQTPSC